MWLLAAAYAGAEGRVRVFDLTGALARLAACTDMQLKVQPLMILSACSSATSMHDLPFHTLGGHASVPSEGCKDALLN